MQNLSEEDYKQKYLKYKAKYLKLKGGEYDLTKSRDRNLYESVNKDKGYIFSKALNAECNGIFSSSASCKLINNAVDEMINVVEKYDKTHKHSTPYYLDSKHGDLIKKLSDCSCLRLRSAYES